MSTFTLLLAVVASNSSVPDITFWDGSWHRVQRANAVYYGWTMPLDSGRVRFQDFYSTGERQMEAIGRPGPPLVKDGPATYYFRSGPKSATGQFANGQREGEWQYWNEDGTLRNHLAWHAGRKVIATYVFKAGDKVPQLVEQMPRFPGPLTLAQYLGATTRRPAQVPPGGGKVYVQFTVGAQGTITSTSIIKGFDPACDAEALRAVAALPRWEPGRHHGQPTAVSFTIPITFR